MANGKNKSVGYYSGQGHRTKPLIPTGRLRHRITIQNFMLVKNSFGEENIVWSDFAKVAASVEPLAGKELFAAQQLHSEGTVQIVIRYVKGVDTKMRVLFRDKALDILHVSDKDERNIALYLLCKNSEEVI